MKRTPAPALPECLALPTPGRAETPGLVSRLHVGVSSNGRIPGLQPGDAGSIPAVSTISKSDGWTCNRCGACCALVDCPHFLQTHWGDGGGVCGIYPDRPVECRVPEVLKEGAPGVVEFYCATCRFLVGQRKRWRDA